jgi:hypothetical protein
MGTGVIAMLVFNTVVGLAYEGELVGLRVKWVKTYDISVEALEAQGLVGFKPEKVRRLKPHGDLLLTDGEIASGKRVVDKSSDELFVRSLVGYIKMLPRVIVEGDNSKLDEGGKLLLARVDNLRGKHIFTKTFGDGEIDLVLFTKDGSDIEVLFHSNAEGQVFLPLGEFLEDVDHS